MARSPPGRRTRHRDPLPRDGPYGDFVLVSLCLDSRRPWGEMCALALCAEEAGMARLYVPDLFMPQHKTAALAGQVHESWTCLSALAVVTTSIGLGLSCSATATDIRLSWRMAPGLSCVNAAWQLLLAFRGGVLIPSTNR